MSDGRSWQRYTDPVARERMEAGNCPECGIAAGDHTGWGRSGCSLTDTGVAGRIAQYQQDLKACHDCGAAPGTPHNNGCDTAVCLWTGGQRLQCTGSMTADVCRVLREAGRPDLADELAHYLSLDDPDHDCGQDVWTGEWPGEVDARNLGLFCYWGPDYGRTGWVECGPDHPGARPDLNRLVTAARWDRASGKWVKR